MTLFLSLIWVLFLGAVTKLGKATISFVIFILLYVRQHGTTRLSLDGFSCNFIVVYFSKIYQEYSSLIEI